MEEEFLKTVIDIYSKIYKTKEEMFLVGYLMACGGERYLLENIEHDIQLLEKDAEFFLPIVKDHIQICREVHEKCVKRAKKLLAEFLKNRGAEIPEWLRE